MSGSRDLQDSERDALRDRNRELATLLEVSKRLASTLHLEEILQAATDGVTRLHALSTAAVYLGEGDVLRLSATTPPLPPQFPDDLRLIPLADHPHLREAVLSGAPVFLKDAASAPLTAAEAAVTRLRGLRSVLYLPLTAGVRCVGALIVASVDEPVTLSPAEVDSCRTLANLAALAVQNAQLYEVGRRNAADLERRIAERERTERALRESEERLRLALMAVEQGLYDLDVQTGETVVTPEYARMLGYDPEEFTETNERWIERLHPDDREAVAGVYRAYVAGETPEYRVEFRQRTKSGGWKWILSIGKIVRYDEAGRPLRMLGTHTDITKRKEAEEERSRLTAQLLQAQKMESVGRLAGGVAHDFNNMLLVILGCAELALGCADREDASCARDLAGDRARRALRAATSRASCSRSPASRPPHPARSNLNELLAETRTMLRRLIGEDVDLVATSAPTSWPVRIDPSQVDQILMNLAVNARDAMPAGGKLTIETTNVRIDESYCRRHAGFRRRRLRPSDGERHRRRDGSRDRSRTSSSPSSRPRTSARAPGWDSPPCTGSSTQNGGFITSTASSGSARPSTSTCRDCGRRPPWPSPQGRRRPPGRAGPSCWSRTTTPSAGPWPRCWTPSASACSPLPAGARRSVWPAARTSGSTFSSPTW